MRAFYNALGAAAGISILAACTGGQSGIQPPSTPVNVQNTTVLQFRVGTARYGPIVTLNTLATYRQTNGLSGTLYNSPTITGPAGFVVPAAGSAGTDAGTNHISSTPPTQPGTTAVVTTFNQSGGVYAYGFANANSNTSGSANYAQFVGGAGANNGIFADEANAIIIPPLAIPPVSGGPGKGNTSINIYGGGTAASAADQGAYANAYMQPFYVSTGSKIPFLLGPPAVPDFHTGTFPAGFLGYDSGFTMFSTGALVAGVYSLTVNVPSATIGVNAATFTQSATLTSTTPLPPVAAPTITDPGTGGASFVVAPAGAGITNQVLYIIDVNSNSGKPTHYAFNVPAAGGTFVLTPTSGPKNPAGVGSPPFAAGDSVYAYVVGADYDVVGLAPPNNTQQAPALPAQADVSVSLIREIVY